jgi:hypothetical protein
LNFFHVYTQAPELLRQRSFPLLTISWHKLEIRSRRLYHDAQVTGKYLEKTQYTLQNTLRHFTHGNESKVVCGFRTGAIQCVDILASGPTSRREFLRPSQPARCSAFPPLGESRAETSCEDQV